MSIAFCHYLQHQHNESFYVQDNILTNHPYYDALLQNLNNKTSPWCHQLCHINQYLYWLECEHHILSFVQSCQSHYFRELVLKHLKLIVSITALGHLNNHAQLEHNNFSCQAKKPSRQPLHSYNQDCLFQDQKQNYYFPIILSPVSQSQSF